MLNSLSFEGGFHYITEANAGKSVLENIGNAIAIIFKPLGFGTWQAAVATILGLVAKEEVVGVFGSLSSMADASIFEIFGGNSIAGFSFMVFNLLCAPCFAAMGAIRREMNNAKWTVGAISYMCVFAYAMSLMIYQFGSWFFGTGNIIGTVVAVLVLIFMLYMLVRKNKYEQK